MALHNLLVMPSSRSLLLIPKRRLITHCDSAMRKSQHSRKKKSALRCSSTANQQLFAKVLCPDALHSSNPPNKRQATQTPGYEYVPRPSIVSPQVGVSHPEELLALPLAPLKAAPLRVWGHLWILFLLLGLFCFQCSRPHTDICVLLLLFGL